jgi:hypothetical protein
MGCMVIHVLTHPREKSRCPPGTSSTLEGKHSPLKYLRIPPRSSVPTGPDTQLLGRSQPYDLPKSCSYAPSISVSV